MKVRFKLKSDVKFPAMIDIPDNMFWPGMSKQDMVLVINEEIDYHYGKEPRWEILEIDCT